MTSLIAFSLILNAGSPGFTNWQQTLASKNSISGKVVVQVVGGASSTVSFDFKKPNLFRIEKADEVLVGDGTTITTYEKKGKIFYKRPQTKEDFEIILHDDKLSMFSGFFGVKPAVVKTVDGSSRTLGGEQFKEINAFFDQGGMKKSSFFVGSNGVVTRSNFTFKGVGLDAKTVSQVHVAKDVVLDGKAGDELFAFKAPGDAKEISYEDLVASKWFYDLDEAKLIAERTGKKIFVDFMASWCGPCKQMDADVLQTQGFKEYSKQLVFCKIDIDLNPTLAEEYKVEAIPNVFVLKADGSVLGSILGFGGPAAFYEELDKILAN